MVLTRGSRAMDSGKNNKNNNLKNTGADKSKMKVLEKKLSNCSNPDVEEDEQNTHANTSTSSGSAGSSIKVTLKKTRSCSSSSSRESTQSFEVVRKLPPMSESVSGEEDGENQKDSDSEKTSDKQQSDEVAENDKESDEESQNDNSSGEEDVEIVVSDDSQESFPQKTIPVVQPVKEENKISINTVVNLKTEEIPPQNASVVKNEDCKVKIKSLKEEPIKKDSDLDNDVVVLKDDSDEDNAQLPKRPENGVEKKDTKDNVKEQKFKVNVRSFDDLAAPRTVNLINMAPNVQLDGQPNFLSQNGAQFPQFLNLLCDVCGIQFDSSDLLNEHKIAMKHFKCSFKECERSNVVISNQQEFLDHQRLIHNIMPSPVQQLAHQVQRLPAMGFEQQLQSGVPPLTENLQPRSSVPNLYTQTLRMQSQSPVPMQRPMRPIMRPNMQQMMPRGRGVPRGGRGRPILINNNMRGNSMKRPASTRPTPPQKRTALNRNSYSNNMNKATPIVKSISESLTKSVVNKNPSTPTQQDVVNLFSKRGLTISTVDSGNNVSIPGLNLNSAVSIIPTSPHKVPNIVPNRVANNVPNRVVKSVPLKVASPILNKNLDTVDLTGPDKPHQLKYYPCDICSKTYTSLEKMYEHVAFAHKTATLQFKCNLCTGSYSNAEMLNRHKLTFHKVEANSSIPFVIPIVDISKGGTANKLQSMGVTSYLPVAQLDSQGGQFGVPIMSISRPGSMEGLRFANFFNLGSIRKL